MKRKTWRGLTPLRITLAIGLLSTGFLAHSADEQHSASFNACMHKSGGVTLNMHNCMSQELALQDARLNAAYQKLRSQLNTVRQKQLKRVERLWIKFRDANCQFYADPDGGTIASLAADGCVLKQTTDRAMELESFIE